MSAEAPDPRIEQVISVIEKRKDTFRKSKACFALIKNEVNAWMLGYGLVTFIANGDAIGEAQDLDYGNFVLMKRFMPVQESMDLLRAILQRKILKLDGYPEIPVKLSFWPLQTYPSGKHGYSSLQWPRLYGSTAIESETTRQLPYGPLSKLGQPLYPSGTDAVAAFFDLPFSAIRQNCNCLELSIPDYRARIKNLKLSGKRVTLEVETKFLKSEALRAKFFCRGESSTYTSGDLIFEKDKVIFECKEEPFIVNASILSEVDGETIDGRSFDYGSPSKEDDVIVEGDDIQLIDIINRGENETVEFKVTLDPHNHEQFLESIVAFTNTTGGRIFVGVDDNGAIKDFRRNIRVQIEDLIQGNCEPKIEVQVRPATIGEHEILIVEVFEGKNKPYFYKDHGIFIRRGSSDRQVTRMELDDLYNKKNQGYPGVVS